MSRVGARVAAERNLGALYRARGRAPETNRFAQTSPSVGVSLIPSRRIRGCEAPEDWSAWDRQEFVEGPVAVEDWISRGTKGERSLDPMGPDKRRVKPRDPEITSMDSFFRSVRSGPR